MKVVRARFGRLHLPKFVSMRGFRKILFALYLSIQKQNPSKPLLSPVTPPVGRKDATTIVGENKAMEKLKGHLLIAVPELPDSNFFRSVVLLFHHDDMGASGVVLNRPASITVQQVWKEVAESECDCSEPVNVGGPVEGPLIALHTSLAAAESEVVPGIFVSMGRENLSTIVTQTVQRFRLFSGYAGWGPGQLEAEIEVGGWLTMPAEIEHVFESPDRLWKIVCETFGHQILQAQIGKHVPSDPSLN